MEISNFLILISKKKMKGKFESLKILYSICKDLNLNYRLFFLFSF